MPITTTYPGVYVNEVPNSDHTIAGVSTSVCAFIGCFARGTSNKAQQLFSLADLENKFGSLFENKNSEAYYSLRQFFLNGGAEAWAVNVKPNTVSASITLQLYNTDDYSESPYFFNIAALSAGTWGNAVKLILNPGSKPNQFNLTILAPKSGEPTGQIEQFNDLSLDPDSSNYILDIINNLSKLIVVNVNESNLPKAGQKPEKYQPMLTGSLINTAELNASGLVGDCKITTYTESDSEDHSFAISQPDIIDLAYQSLIGSSLLESKISQLPGLAGIKFFKTSDGISVCVGNRANPTKVVFASTNDKDFLSMGKNNTLAGNLATLNLAKFDGDKICTVAVGNNAPISFTLKASELKNIITLINKNLGKLFAAKSRSISLNNLHFTANGNLVRALSEDVNILLVSLTLPAAANTKISANYQNYHLGQIPPLPSKGAAKPTALTADNFTGLDPLKSGVVFKSLQKAAYIDDQGMLVTSKLPTQASDLKLPDLNANPSQLSKIYQKLQSAAKASTGSDSLLATAFANAQNNAVSGSDGTQAEEIDYLGDPEEKSGLYALENVDMFNLLCIPETRLLNKNRVLGLISSAQSYCEKRRAFYIIDYPIGIDTPDDMDNWLDVSNIRNNNSAIYFPHLQISDPVKNFSPRQVAGSGTLAGLFTRTDIAYGVWKAPAGTDAVLEGITKLDYDMNDSEDGVLTQNGLNALRTFPGYGIISWGARTLIGTKERVGNDAYSYVPARRTAYFIEESLRRGLKWVVFEPNDEPLWANIRLAVTSFMQELFQKRAFQGTTPKEAYLVKCDSGTTTQDDINQGIVNITVGFAPLKPAEFVIINFQQSTKVS